MSFGIQTLGISAMAHSNCCPQHCHLVLLLSCSEAHLELVQWEKRVQGLLTLSVPHSSAKMREVEAARESAVSCYVTCASRGNTAKCLLG